MRFGQDGIVVEVSAWTILSLDDVDNARIGQLLARVGLVQRDSF